MTRKINNKIFMLDSSKNQQSRLVVNKYTIAGGNSTALVKNSTANTRNTISKSLLTSVEQVGFVLDNNSLPQMSMMGGELSINGTIAFAYSLNGTGQLFTSGITTPVFYINSRNRTEILLPLSYRQIDNIILLDGIGYLLLNSNNKNEQSSSKANISSLCAKFDLPAFGVLLYQNNQISPRVFVRELGSFVDETACGSGSVAFSLFSGVSKVIQPTGQKISVIIDKSKSLISILATARKIQ